jgi:hypothetical protein
MATTVDVAEEVKIPGRDCADLKSKLRKGEVFRRGVRLATVRRTRLSMNGQASANAPICAQVIFQTSSASACYAGAGSAAGLCMASSMVSAASHATLAIFLIK